MKQTVTCKRNNNSTFIHNPFVIAHFYPQPQEASVTISRKSRNLVDLQMPRIAAMTSDGAERLGQGVGQNGATSEAVVSSSTEHDVIEPRVFNTTCEWAAGRPDVIRMDVPNPAAIANSTANNTIELQQVESSLSLNTGISLPSSVLYHNASSNSNLAPFPTVGLGSDSNSNWPISRHVMEHQNSNLNNPTDVGRISTSDSNGLLRSIDPRSFSWFPQGSQVFSNDDDDHNESTFRQMQSSRRMTRSMRRRVMTNGHRQDIELRPLADLNSTVLTSRPRRSSILTRTRSSPPSHISIPNPTVPSAAARNSASTRIGSSSPNIVIGVHPPLTTSSIEAASITRNVLASAVASSPSSKSVERPVTHCTRKRSSVQANISPQNESRKRAASSRNPEVSQPMSTRSQSSTLSSKKQKKTVDIKMIPVTNKDTPTNDKSKRCCICLDEPTKPEISKLDSCKHIYCFLCIEKWAERENTCPLCKTRFHKIERVHKVVKPRGRRGATAKGSPVHLKNVKKVKNRDQRSDYGRNVQWQGLLERMEAGGLHHHFAQFIFSGLNAFGTPNLMSFEANVPNVSPFSSAINIQRMPSRQHSTPQRTSTSNNRSTFAEYATRSRQNNVARVRGHNHTIGDDVTRSLSALRSTLLSHRLDPISSPSETNVPRASFADFQPPITHGASEAFGVGGGDVGPHFNREASDPFASVDLDASMESNDESEDEGNPSRFYQRIRNIRRERSAVMERFHFNGNNAESGSFHRASAVYENVAPVDSLGNISSSVFGDTFDRVLSVPRSFAANGHQADAGETAATPLEIMDSDDDDDGVVEVLVVNQA